MTLITKTQTRQKRYVDFAECERTIKLAGLFVACMVVSRLLHLIRDTSVFGYNYIAYITVSHPRSYVAFFKHFFEKVTKNI